MPNECGADTHEYSISMCTQMTNSSQASSRGLAGTKRYIDRSGGWKVWIGTFQTNHIPQPHLLGLLRSPFNGLPLGQTW
jgi:hypothetical protein